MVWGTMYPLRVAGCPNPASASAISLLKWRPLLRSARHALLSLALQHLLCVLLLYVVLELVIGQAVMHPIRGSKVL